MVFYRKYRPQTIDELDSDVVKKTLHAVLSQKETPHAFLFTGPKGLGKTSTARIVAKFVNCTSKKEKPCNVCESCISITNGTNVDILEIDGASNRGIDEIRDLREKIRLLPVSANMKVYIIDEVHMLTTEAFNALLKTLEEPPLHAMFILCTTEQQKVPDTIVSRCFHIQFKKASTADLVASFERIVAGEKMTANKDALELIASLSEGSFRDGAKILEEMSLFSEGKQITAEVVGSYYHITEIAGYIRSFFQTLIQKDTKKGLQIIQEVLDVGIDIRYFTEQLLFALHEFLLQKVGLHEGKTIEMDMDTIKGLVTALSQAYSEMKYAVLPQLPLELVVVEWTQSPELRIKNQESQEVNEKEKVVTANKVFTLKDSGNLLGKQSSTSVQDKPLNSTSDVDFLHQVLDSLKKENHMLAGVLRSCKIHQENNTLIIEAPSAFHKEKLTEPKAVAILEKVCEDITGKHIEVLITSKGGE